MRYENSYDPTGMRQLQPFVQSSSPQGVFPKVAPGVDRQVERRERDCTCV